MGCLYAGDAGSPDPGTPILGEGPQQPRGCTRYGGKEPLGSVACCDVAPGGASRPQYSPDSPSPATPANPTHLIWFPCAPRIPEHAPPSNPRPHAGRHFRGAWSRQETGAVLPVGCAQLEETRRNALPAARGAGRPGAAHGSMGVPVRWVRGWIWLGGSPGSGGVEPAGALGSPWQGRRQQGLQTLWVCAVPLSLLGLSSNPSILAFCQEPQEPHL